MATRKAAKRTAAKEQVITITAEQFTNGLARFSRVLDYVERDMRRADVATANEATGFTPPAPPSQPSSVEQKASLTAEYSYKLYAMADELRGRILYGGIPKNADGVAQQATPSEGPIKDALNAAMTNMDRVAACLDDIARYVAQ